MSKNKLGQYFTKNLQLKNKVYDFILNNPTTILEPSVGRGDLVDYVLSKNNQIQFDMFEIDNTIKLLNSIDSNKVIYKDFITTKINKTYDTIIGNPPYIRTKTSNLYIDFINKCVNLLNENGELIFIIPSDFFKLTCSVKVLNDILQKGTFTHIYHNDSETLFENANINVIVFRYCKNFNLPKTLYYNDNLLYLNNNNGLITFDNKINNNLYTFDDVFDICVGMVSGKEEIFKNDIGNIKLITGNNKIEKYIYIEKFPSEYNDINEYLIKNKEVLLSRKIKKFNDNNWFEWGAPRNIKYITNNLNKNCIYLYNLTRKSEVAFINKVNYFGGNLIMLVPKNLKTPDSFLKKILEYLNSSVFKNNFTFSKRFKIGHRQISNSIIPSFVFN
jgi:adenine-specific DNA-methyltransferase